MVSPANYEMAFEEFKELIRLGDSMLDLRREITEFGDYSKYSAPPIPGWRHLGNSSRLTLRDVESNELPTYAPGKEKRIEPFFPTGDDPKSPYWEYKIKWAIYVKED